MKKMFFAAVVATSLLTASFANAQNEVKKAPAAQQQKPGQKVQTSTVKQNDKKATAPATTKAKPMTKTEKAPATK